MHVSEMLIVVWKAAASEHPIPNNKRDHMMEKATT
jgi:hypothetical protein